MKVIIRFVHDSYTKDDIKIYSYSPEKIEEIKISINQWASSFFKNNDHLPDYVDPYSNYDYDWAIGTEDYNRGYLVQDIIEDAIAELNKEE